MGMQVGGEEGGFVAAINVTPMVDVMLVLLIIFMVVTPFLDSGVSVVLPKGPHGEEDAAINKESAVIIAIPSDGIYYFGQDVISLNDLSSRIERMMEGKPIEERIVYVKGDNRVHYREVVKVVDAVRNAGIERIGLIVDVGDEARASGGG